MLVVAKTFKYALLIFSEVPALYFVHMKGQFKFIHSQKLARRVIDSSVQLSSVREIFLEEDHKKNTCLLPHQYSDEYWYKSSEDEMGNCTVPWTMNNSRICMNWEDAEEATKIDRQIIVSCTQFVIFGIIGHVCPHGLSMVQ